MLYSFQAHFTAGVETVSSVSSITDMRPKDDDSIQTVATLRSFILQMTTRVDIQRHAQEELDRICPDRLVTFADRENLPYIECLLMEIYRFHPVVPYGIFHTNEQEDVFEGMRIPKGSMVMANIWYLTLSGHAGLFLTLNLISQGNDA